MRTGLVAPAPAAATPGVAPHSARLPLAPARLFGAVWVVVAGSWLLMSDTTYGRLTGSTRVVEDGPLLLTLVAVAAFVTAANLGWRSGARRDGAPARSSAQVLADYLAGPAGRRMVLLTYAVPTGACALLLLVVMQRSGGLGAIVGGVTGGRSLTSITEDVVRSPIWERVEALTHVLPVNAVLLAAGRAFGVGLPARRRQVLVLTGFAATGVLSLVTADRLIFYEHVVAYVAAGMLLARLCGRRALTAKTVLRITAVAVAIVLMWIVAEYARSYTARYGESAVAPTPFEFAQDRVAAYYLTSFNNLQAVMTEPSPVAFPARTLPATVTLLGLFEAQDADATERQEDVLASLYHRSRRLTTFTLLGYLYIDGGPIAVVLVSAMLGYGAGVVHRRASSSVVCLLVYPTIVVAILDSARVNFVFDTRGVIAIVVAAVVARSATKAAARHDPSSTAVPGGPAGLAAAAGR